ncbi:MAG: electron transfer flavoprotein subunit beta/FixA family protein [Bacteroidales bacterium]|nr:electron transfer flavoprotein subunit beta/FixA family protein [Bacteroidales bacterium]MDD2686979.1 electron transfer flavoprotein subunit beta/FixA family protein [Bacteroidales bacterium]MDD3331039.1 electron transfer flavoprotein subunit beta/FixA family protein [Bacteroidales bacterium]MDD3690984.1 electron transfer flavoprotein subunit beta/FixA family protein [Bacteroidales bacterium]MDD4044349.1 electron transfer flavoprotein subunit beta/FixA family protein [Bacteroidales bacterium
MNLKIVVLAKQVPDTRNVGKDAMKEDGTVNRGALPAIFNPDDLNALEMALEIKDRRKDVEVIVLTMGPGRAADIIREAIFRGADKGYLLTDRKFAGSDTLATSYALYKAVQKINPDLIICGLQAIDGDTAQVGPQIAEKLQFPQVTYVEKLNEADERQLVLTRRLERGIETVKVNLPALITVHASANPCRPKHAKRMLKYKHAHTLSELQDQNRDYTDLFKEHPYLRIEEWNAESVEADESYLGLSGSPTKVKGIESVVLTQKESKRFTDKDQDIDQLMKELLETRVIG